MAQPLVDRSVAAADRALSILDAFAEGNGVCSLPELTEATGLFKSVICRYLISFERCGYVFKRPDGRYQLAAQALRLGKAYEKALDLSQHVLPVLQELVAQTQESSSFYVRQGDKRLCLYRVDSPFALRVTIQPGTILPMDDAATALVLARFSPGPDARKHQDPSEFIQGSANKPRQDFTASISIPVFGLDDKLVGALTLSGPVSRFDPFDCEAERACLARAAIGLSAQLGSVGAYPEGTAWFTGAGNSAARSD